MLTLNGPQGSMPQGIGTNPVLDELDNLSPAAKQAATDAHTQIVGQTHQNALAQIQPPQIGDGLPGLQPTAEMTQAATPQIPHIAPPRQNVPTLGPAPVDVSGNQAEFSRLTAPATPGLHDHNQTGLSGIGQIHNPWARIPLQIADAIGSTFAPRLTAMLPGTQLHHNMLVKDQEGAIKEGESEANDQQKRGLEAAQTAYSDARPEIEDAKNETNILKTQLGDAQKRDSLAQKTENDLNKFLSGLSSKGLKRDDAGNIVDDPTTELGKKNVAQREYVDAQRGLAEATAELRRAQATAEPEKIRLAESNRDLMLKRIAISEANLGIRSAESEARMFGTHDGVALPGATMDQNGNVVGQMFAGNVKPTASQMTKADMGNSMKLQLHTMRDILGRHPEFFGPAGGRGQKFEAWLGTQDPDVQRFMTAQNFAAEHGSGMFGSRNYGVIKDIKGNFRMDMKPEALMSALDQAEQTADEFTKAGTRHTAQGGESPKAPAQNGPKVGTVEGGYRFKGGDPSKPESWEKAQ